MTSTLSCGYPAMSTTIDLTSVHTSTDQPHQDSNALNVCNSIARNNKNNIDTCVNADETSTLVEEEEQLNQCAECLFQCLSNTEFKPCVTIFGGLLFLIYFIFVILGPFLWSLIGQNPPEKCTWIWCE